MNPCIKKVYLFLESETDTARVKIEEKYRRKLNFVVLGRRMTFSDAFHFSNERLIRNEGDIVIVANDDIAFDESLSYLENGIGKDVVFALTRWEAGRKIVDLDMKSGSTMATEEVVAERLLMSGRGDLSWHLMPRIDSQDAWIFGGAMTQGVVEKSNFYQGRPRCDGRIAHILREEGFEVKNPSVAIRIRHLQNTVGGGGDGGGGGGGGGGDVARGFGYDTKMNVKGETSFVQISDTFLFSS